MPTFSFDDITSITLPMVEPYITDNFFESFVLLNKLKKTGKVRTAGGTRIDLPIENDDNPSGQAYSNYDVLNSTVGNILGAATYDWAQYSWYVAISGMEEFRNKGEVEIKDLLRAKIDNAIKSASKMITTDLFAAQTGLKINGLQDLVSDAGTGTVGGINSSTSTFWQNKVKTSVGSAATNLVDKMREGYNDATFGPDRPNFIVTTQAIYEFYENTMDAKEMYITVNGETLNLGQPALAWHGVPIVFDRSCGSGRMYMLNTDHIYIYLGEGKDFKMTPFMPLYHVNQDARAARLFVYLQFCVDSRRTHCVLSGITA